MVLDTNKGQFESFIEKAFHYKWNGVYIHATFIDLPY